MKEFYFYNNIDGLPPEIAITLFGIEPKIIGWKYNTGYYPNKFGRFRHLTLYLWRWFYKIPIT